MNYRGTMPAYRWTILAVGVAAQAALSAVQHAAAACLAAIQLTGGVVRVVVGRRWRCCCPSCCSRAC